MSIGYDINGIDGAEDRPTLETVIISPQPLRPPSSLLRAPLQLSIIDGPQSPTQPNLQFSQYWDYTLAVHFADYISYAMHQYGVPIPGLFTIAYGPTPVSATVSGKTREYSIVARVPLGQLREDIVRLCILKCVKALGAGREVLFSIRLGFPPVEDGPPRTTTLASGRLWDLDRWDAGVLGDELCVAGANETVWGDGAWERVHGLAGRGGGVEYEIRRVR
ncbi:hypothetical protein F5X97DRAFT_322537 [Nemania serpens]|nr:hypothetical protein F5X97DRAFT_322537 [Nemania serpens]